MASPATGRDQRTVLATETCYVDLRIADTKKAVEAVPEIGTAPPKNGLTTAQGG